MITYIEGNFDREAQSGKYNHAIINTFSSLDPRLSIGNRNVNNRYLYNSHFIGAKKYKYISLVEILGNTIQEYREGLAEFGRDASFSHKILIQKPKDWELKKDSISLILSKHNFITIIKCI